MESKNSGPARVALYIRVSTDEQAKSGYSVDDQERRLLVHAQREGWHVVDVVVDDGYSGGLEDRPGIRHVKELAQAGEIDAVMATKIDRYFRDEYFFFGFERQLRESGVRMLAFDKTGNRVGDAVLIGYAAWEREQIAERIRNGKLQKAINGMVVGGHNRAHGYQFVRNDRGKVVGYEVDQVEMSVVRRIFSDKANGKGIRTIKDRLDLERVPTPGRGKSWSRPFIRSLILDDLYRPHTVDELAN